MNITIHSTFLPHNDPDASLAFYRDTLGFEVRNDVGYGGMHWITVRPADQPATSIVLYPPAATPGVTDDERRTIVEMMAKGTYATILLATKDPRRYLRAGAGQRRRRRPGANRAAVRGSRLRLPRSRGHPDPHPGAALSRPAIAGLRGETGDQTDQESRSVGHRAAARVTAMNISIH